jgi:hypothetical protein
MTGARKRTVRAGQKAPGFRNVYGRLDNSNEENQQKPTLYTNARWARLSFGNPTVVNSRWAIGSTLTRRIQRGSSAVTGLATPPRRALVNLISQKLMARCFSIPVLTAYRTALAQNYQGERCGGDHCRSNDRNDEDLQRPLNTLEERLNDL